MKRPLAVAAIALIWGIILADVNKSHIWGIISLTLSLLIFILIYRPAREKSSVFVLLALPFLISGYVLHSINKNYYDNACKEWEGKSVSVKGTLHNEPEFKNGRTRFVLKVESIDNKPLAKNRKIKIQVSIYGDDLIDDLNYGSVVNITGEIRIPPGRRNIGGFDSGKFLASRGISGTMSTQVKAFTILDGNRGSWLKETGYRLRHNILKTLNSSMP